MDHRKPRVLRDLYDLILWYARHIDKFPRSWRIVLGDRLMNLLMEVQSNTIRAYYGRNKRNLLEQSNLILEEIRILTRMVTELRCLTLAQQEYAAKSLEEIGRQIGGWLKSEKE